MDQHYIWKNIRTLLTEGFSAEELRHLCFDEPSFKPVYDKLASNPDKTTLIDWLLEYARQQLRVEVLLAWAKESNSHRYDLHQPYYTPDNFAPAYYPQEAVSAEGHHFICYAPSDAGNTARQLADALQAGSPSFQGWLDERDLRPGQDFDKAIVEAIQACTSLLFIMTPDSVTDDSPCKQEWTRALKYKKPIIPLLFKAEVEPPLRLESRQLIDFTGPFDPAMEQLRQHLQWLSSPEGVRQSLKDRLTEAQRDLRYADTAQKARIQNEIELLQKQIKEQQKVIDNPEEVKQRVQDSIERGLERERKPEQAVMARAGVRFINPPPGTAPYYFQDRVVETHELARFLSDERQQLIAVVGRGGIGKTAIVCRLLKALEKGRLPDSDEALEVDGIVYLSAIGSHRVDMPTLYADLSKLLPQEIAAKLEPVSRDPKVSVAEKMQKLLDHFPPERRVVVLLDNFEDVVDAEKKERPLKDPELDEALVALLQAPPHAIKVIITTRVTPAALLTRVKPGGQRVLELDQGLESPYAENILREMDRSGNLGLRNASAEMLQQARERTRGYPRALEALVAILEVDRDTSLEELLLDAAKLLPENVIQVLVGEAFSRLDRMAQQVMHALAIYGRPVPPVAVDYLLQRFYPDIDSAPVLGRLVNMHFARKESGRYYLHPVDRQYALSRLPLGQEADRWEDELPFTFTILIDRAADYFSETRKPRDEWKTLADLQPQRDEFDLRCEGGYWETAFAVLESIEDYLERWGYYWLVMELRERLEGKLADKEQQYFNKYGLGTSYYKSGKTEQAARYLEQALTLARELKDTHEECRALGTLGYCYSAWGEVEQAIDYYEQAMVVACESGNHKLEAELFSILAGGYLEKGNIKQAIDYYEQGLARTREGGDWDWEGGSLRGLGDCYAKLGQTLRAIECYEQALRIAYEGGDRDRIVSALNGLGSCYKTLGQAAYALGYYEQVYVLEYAIGNLRGEGFARRNMGSCYLTLGWTEKAIAAYQQAAEIANKVGNLREESGALREWGSCYLKLGQHEPAIKTYQQALVVARQSGDRREEGIALNDLGWAYAQAGQFQPAVTHYEQAITLYGQIGDQRQEAATLRNLGDCYADMGQLERSIEYYQQSLVIDRRTENRKQEALSLGGLGYYSIELGQIATAIQYYEQALILEREIGDRTEEGVSLENIGYSYSMIGQIGRAIKYYEEALVIQRQTGDPSEQSVSLCNLGRCHRILGQAERAIEYYEQALTIAREAGIKRREAMALRGIGYCLVDLSKLAEAIQRFTQAVQITQNLGSENREKQLSQLGLALAQLYADDLPAARSAVDIAYQYNVPESNHSGLALLDVITVRQGDYAAAREAFITTITQADKLLSHTPQLYGVLESKGLALCGLALCGQLEYLPAAVEAFTQARQVTQAAGAVRELLRLFDALAVADTNGMLKEARQAAAGESI